MAKSISVHKNTQAWYKRAILLVLLLATCLVFCACDGNADENVSPYLEFTLLEDGTYSVKASAQLFKESNVSVEIPAKYKRKAVTTIEEDGFRDATGLIDITIPDSVIHIGEDAFLESGVYNNSANWSSGVFYIGTHLIYAKADKIPTNYTIKSGTTCIADEAFYVCHKLTNITFPSSLKAIGARAFIGCKELLEIHISANVSYISEAAFSSCTYLYNITVDTRNKYYHETGNCLIETNSKTLIAGCDNSVIPNDGSVTRIGASSFSSRLLKNFTIPNTVTSIGDFAFENCKYLKEIELSDNISVIGSSAFRNCAALKNITLPSKLKTIGYAFSSCDNLSSITISGDVTKIEKSAFYGCKSLRTIYFLGTMQQWNAIEKDSGWDKETGKYTVYCSDGSVRK